MPPFAIVPFDANAAHEDSQPPSALVWRSVGARRGGRGFRDCAKAKCSKDEVPLQPGYASVEQLLFQDETLR